VSYWTSHLVSSTSYHLSTPSSTDGSSQNDQDGCGAEGDRGADRSSGLRKGRPGQHSWLDPRSDSPLEDAGHGGRRRPLTRAPRPQRVQARLLPSGSPRTRARER
jgi:hypothetical protein